MFLENEKTWRRSQFLEKLFTANYGFLQEVESFHRNSIDKVVVLLLI